MARVLVQMEKVETVRGRRMPAMAIQAARSARRRELRGQINQRIAVVARHLPDLASAKPTPAPDAVDQPKKRPKLRTYLEDGQ